MPLRRAPSRHDGATGDRDHSTAGSAARPRWHDHRGLSLPQRSGQRRTVARRRGGHRPTRVGGHSRHRLHQSIGCGAWNHHARAASRGPDSSGCAARRRGSGSAGHVRLSASPRRHGTVRLSQAGARAVRACRLATRPGSVALPVRRRPLPRRRRRDGVPRSRALRGIARQRRRGSRARRRRRNDGVPSLLHGVQALLATLPA